MAKVIDLIKHREKKKEKKYQGFIENLRKLYKLKPDNDGPLIA